MSDKQKALDLALMQIERQFGKGSIMKLGEASAKLNVEVIPTGTLALDIALGVGAYRRAGLLKYSVLNHPAKQLSPSTLSPNHKKMGGIAAFIDAEHAPRSCLRSKFRCRYRKPAGISAGYRRTSPGNCRSPGAQRGN